MELPWVDQQLNSLLAEWKATYSCSAGGHIVGVPRTPTRVWWQHLNFLIIFSVIFLHIFFNFFTFLHFPNYFSIIPLFHIFRFLIIQISSLLPAFPFFSAFSIFRQFFPHRFSVYPHFLFIISLFFRKDLSAGLSVVMDYLFIITCGQKIDDRTLWTLTVGQP